MKPARPHVRGGARVGSSERGQREGGGALKARRACCCARPARWAPPGGTAIGPRRTALPKPGRFLEVRAPARQASGPRPHPRRPLRGSGVAAPARRRSTLRRTRVGSAQADQAGILGWRPGAGRRAPGAAALQRGADPKGGGQAGHSPKYTVLSHLGHLEAMVRTPSRPASSARARLLAAALTPPAAPAPPAAVRPPIGLRPGRGVEPPRSRRPGRRGGRGAPAGADWGLRHAPGAPASLSGGLYRARSVLACFHGSFGATGWAAGGAGTPRPPDGGRPGQQGLGPEGRRRGSAD